MNRPMIFENMVTHKIRADYERIFRIPITNPAMNDSRRELHEEKNEATRCSTQAILGKDGNEPLGIYFHRNEVEAFFVVDGEVDLLIALGEKGAFRQEYKNIPAGTMIVMPPRVVHTFFLKPGCKMICYGTGPFDHADVPVSQPRWPEAPVEPEVSRRAPRH